MFIFHGQLRKDKKILVVGRWRVGCIGLVGLRINDGPFVQHQNSDKHHNIQLSPPSALPFPLEPTPSGASDDLLSGVLVTRFCALILKSFGLGKGELSPSLKSSDLQEYVTFTSPWEVGKICRLEVLD
ncbi:hypothetical protein Nepgr_028631 [Nepenthes gracilis]|uniref:Uncharacterized protein n=1 Tax=Nepenthes gracilis TaxID=150966 RepID=A0AAD3Y2K6_NEPGR|nr:hypothetical protein Nepgr_028631 [Nepenthes gracilis]